MCKFAKEFEKKEIVQQDAGQIPWVSLITIMEKCKSKQERLWYMQKTFENEETPLILTKIISFEELEDYLKKNK